jgi:hypothetical protein
VAVAVLVPTMALSVGHDNNNNSNNNTNNVKKTSQSIGQKIGLQWRRDNVR